MRRVFVTVLLATFCMCFVGVSRSISAYADEENALTAAASRHDRYTVLVLDVSGPTTFTFNPYIEGIILRPGGGAKYTAYSSIDDVKSAALGFIRDSQYSLSANHIAVVAYDNEAWIVTDFTDDLTALESAIDSLEESPSENDNDGPNIAAGLKCADDLLSSIADTEATKNVLLCTTGLTTTGEHSDEGLYGEGTVASDWQNEQSGVRLYAYANAAISAADALKDEGACIYVIGIFDPIEAALPSEGKDVASFFRLTAHDLASGEGFLYTVEDTSSLEFVFDELQGDVSGSGPVRLFNNSDGYGAWAKQDSSGGTMLLGGYAEEALWGPSLFEVPATRMHMQSLQSEDSPHHHLALVCGALCLASYDSEYLIQAHRDLGFQDDGIFLYSYPDSSFNRPNALRDGRRFSDDEEYGFSIASRTMTVEGEECDILLITMRGTHNLNEIREDRFSAAGHDFYGYKAFNYAYEFEEDVFAGLQDYYSEHSNLGTRRLVILVCGYSLAGSAANLVAARLNLEAGNDAWYSKNTTVDDIYAYTFGAIDSLSRIDTNNGAQPRIDANDENGLAEDGGLTNDIGPINEPELIEFPISEGFENITNIYNYLDSFGPNGYWLATTNGNSMYGKFGLFDTFRNDMSGIVSEASLWPTHEMAGYEYAVRSGWTEPDFSTDAVRVSIRCPVDVQVFVDDKEILDIQADKVVSISDGVHAVVEDRAKTILLPKGATYRIAISSTDEGTMSFSVTDLDPVSPISAGFQDVVLEDGKEFEGELLGTGSVEDTSLYVVDQNGKRVASVMGDGSETRISPFSLFDRFFDESGLAKGFNNVWIIVAAFLATFIGFFALLKTWRNRK